MQCPVAGGGDGALLLEEGTMGILGLMRYIGFRLGLPWDNGKDNGNCYNGAIQGLCCLNPRP